MHYPLLFWRQWHTLAHAWKHIDKRIYKFYCFYFKERINSYFNWQYITHCIVHTCFLSDRACMLNRIHWMCRWCFRIVLWRCLHIPCICGSLCSIIADVLNWNYLCFNIHISRIIIQMPAWSTDNITFSLTLFCYIIFWAGRKFAVRPCSSRLRFHLDIILPPACRLQLLQALNIT